MSVGAMGTMPSQFLLVAHGSSLSSAVSAMQPARSQPANTAAPARQSVVVIAQRGACVSPLVSEKDIVRLQLVLLPGVEDIADDVVLALDFLAETDAPDKLAGLAVEAGTPHAQLNGG